MIFSHDKKFRIIFLMLFVVSAFTIEAKPFFSIFRKRKQKSFFAKNKVILISAGIVAMAGLLCLFLKSGFVDDRGSQGEIDSGERSKISEKSNMREEIERERDNEQSKRDVRANLSLLHRRLHELCESNNHRDLFLFLAGRLCRLNLNSRDELGNTPLHRVCESGNLKAVKCLIFFSPRCFYRRININAKNAKGKDPLDIACKGWMRQVIEFCSKKARVNEIDDQGNTMLHRACDVGYLEIAQYLMSKGGNPRVIYSFSGLYLTATRLKIVKCLMKKGATLEVANCEGLTPLHIACKHGNLDVVKCLVESGANFNAINDYHRTPLSEACRKQHFEIIKYLVEKGAFTKGNWGERLLFDVCKKNTTVALEIVKYLVENGADVNPENLRFGMLVRTLKRRNIDVAKYLLEQGAHTNAKDCNQDTALHEVCRYPIAKIGFVEQLIKEGGDVNVKNQSGNTPLYNVGFDFIRGAFMEIKEELLPLARELSELLIRNGANIGVVHTIDGHLFISGSVLHNHAEILSLLELLKTEKEKNMRENLSKLVELIKDEDTPMFDKQTAVAHLFGIFRSNPKVITQEDLEKCLRQIIFNLFGLIPRSLLRSPINRGR